MRLSVLLRPWVVWCCVAAVAPLAAQTAETPLRQQAQQALRQAVEFYRTQVARHGGYVYYYSLDLQQRIGEGVASPDTIFVQPPGTPTVGLAYLRAYAATGEPYYLAAAQEAAEALVYGQLQSGGWTQVIHFSGGQSPGRLGRYRHGRGGSWNVSSLDDGQTQAALELLMRVDEALRFRHGAIHEAAQYGLAALLAAQFPNGAFPQVWTQAVEARPIVAARFPDYDWKTQGRVKNYWDYYTLNDDLAGTVADTLITAHQVYGDDKYRAALRKLGDFLLLAQMPEPQPGWCQQYNDAMHPIWARKFEPPAITAGESQDVMETLIEIARYTGEPKYLALLPRALAYFRKCLLPDGQLARYYELRTNRPLYMNAQYELTYDDSAVPAHYGWKVPSRLEVIERSYEASRRGSPDEDPRPLQALEAEVRTVIAELDAQGRWISVYAGQRLVGQPKFAEGFRYLSSAVFSRNVEVLSEYLARTAPPR
jgi:hypothetical protein